MKKLNPATLAIAVLLVLPPLFQNCGSSKTAVKEKISYETHIAPLVQERCSPCHFENPKPDKGLLNTYSTMKLGIDEIINRVQLDTSDKGFMPFKSKKEPLTEAEINLLKEWRAQSMPK